MNGTTNDAKNTTLATASRIFITDSTAGVAVMLGLPVLDGNSFLVTGTVIFATIDYKLRRGKKTINDKLIVRNKREGGWEDDVQLAAKLFRLDPHKVMDGNVTVALD